MKLNSRLLVGNLCAAGSVAVFSAILVAGCATGERTGKFWDKGDVKSSDAYVATEMARDQSVAQVDSAPRANGKITPVSGTQDNTGHVSLDFPDPPPAPPVAGVTSAPTTTATAARSAQSAGAQVSNAQIAGAATGGAIVAPYVQKRPPSGGLDNSRHDGEIVKPNAALAKQLDPFAATDAGPFASPPTTTKRLEAPGAVHVSKPALVASGAPAAPPVAPQADVWATASPGQRPIELVPSTQPAPPSTPASYANKDAFDPSTPPAAGGAVGAPRSASIVLRSHSGVRLGDEDLNTDQQSSSYSDDRPIVESGATQATPEAPPSAPSSPYESDTRHEANRSGSVANNSGCVTPPAAPVRSPSANAPSPPSPTQDSWESTNISIPARSSRVPTQPVPTPVYEAVTSVAPAAPSIRKTAAALQPAQASEMTTRAPIAPPAAPFFAATTKPAERERPEPSSVRFEPSTISGGSDPMICDSASIHGRYTGDDALSASPAKRDPFDVPLQRSSAILSPTPANSAAPVKKLNAPLENKSTSWWDDPLSSPSKSNVRTADFSVPAPPLPFDGDEAASKGLRPGSLPQPPSVSSSRSRSRGWFVSGIVLGLAVSAVIWRRRRCDKAA